MKTGAEPRLLKPGLYSETFCTALPLAPLKATYILSAFFVFVDHSCQ